MGVGFGMRVRKQKILEKVISRNDAHRYHDVFLKKKKKKYGSLI